MPLNFRDAAYRHFDDAELLYQQNQQKRLANADHLYGLAAECSIKAIMAGLGAPVSKKGNPLEHTHKVHIEQLWDEFLDFAGGRIGFRYFRVLKTTSPFSDWNINQRYDDRSNFKRLQVKAHQEATFVLIKTLEYAILDGVI